MDPFAPKTNSNPIRTNQNFIEALKSIGGHTLHSVGHDLIGGIGRDATNAVFGSNKTNENFPLNQLNTEALLNQEREWRERTELQTRHQEMLKETAIYNRQEEEDKVRIKVLQEELKALADEMDNLSLSLQNVINQQIARPGRYHVTFLEKLRRFILNLRKQVADANNWLEISYARRQAKQFFWGNVTKSGTKFMLSQERQIAISAG